MYQRILVPLDGSPTAHRGLDAALQLARRFDASVVLLSVLEIPPAMVGLDSGVVWPQVISELRADLQRVLDAAHQAAKAAGVANEAHLVDGAAMRVCDVIADAARQHRCDLIVMGTHGRRGLAHALVGSDAERVLRLAPCALHLVR